MVEMHYDDKKSGWEYKLKDTNNMSYNEGAWVSEKELTEA